MKKIVYSLAGSFVFILLYLLVIYSIASGALGNGGDIFNKSPTGGAMVEIGVDDQVAVQVTRDRWYGTIVETHSPSGVMSELYVFDIFGIPIKAGNTDLTYVHLSVIILVIFINILCLFIDIIGRRPTQE